MRGAARAALILALAASGTDAFAKLPDWAREAAESAPPLPEGMPEWPERTLLEETHVVVATDGGTWRIERRTLIQVLSNRVEDTAIGTFAFDDTTKVRKSKGWHVPPGERAERNLGGALDLTLPGEFLTDARTRMIALEGVKKGSLLAYEFEAESRPRTLTTTVSFYDPNPVLLSRWSIDLPPQWSLKHAWLPFGGAAPARVGNAWVFEQRDLSPPPEEPFGDQPAHTAPFLVVALQPPEGIRTPAPAFADWNSVARWYEDLARGREASTPEIAAAAAEALAKVGHEPLDRIRAVALFVRDRVRYVAREVGIGGYQPHAASQVLFDLYGDCKDKGTLLRAALATAGFTSFPVLVHSSNPSTVSPEVPAVGSFDHFVVGVLWPKDVAVPPEASAATVETAEGQRLLIVDPTDAHAWPGTLPYNLEGQTGLVVVGGRGSLVRLPAGNPRSHRIARTEAASLAGDRSVSIRLVSRYYGGPAEEERAAHAASEKDHREDVESELRSAWPGAGIEEYRVTPEDADGAYVESVTITAGARGPALRQNAFGLFTDGTRDLERVPLGKRKSAVVYPYPLEIRYETTVTGIPETESVPTPRKVAGDGWSVESAFDRTDGAIRGELTIVRTRTRFEPSGFSELKRFWSTATKAASPALSLAP